MILHAATTVTALACAVCFGEPGAPMTEGAMAGVLVLAGLIIGVLAWIVVVIRFMLRRARAVQEAAGQDSSELGRHVGGLPSRG